MKIECTLKRKGGTHVDMPGKKYHFEPQEDGRHIAEVEDDAHIERFLSITEAYRIARAPGAAPVASIATAGLSAAQLKQPEMPPLILEPGQVLLGSTEHPPLFTINDKVYTLQNVLLRAFQDSGLTFENWNDLDEDARAAKIDIVLDGIEAGEMMVPDEPTQPPQQSGDERAQLDAQYKGRFGRLPPSNMKTETLKAKLAAGLE